MENEHDMEIDEKICHGMITLSYAMLEVVSASYQKNLDVTVSSIILLCYMELEKINSGKQPDSLFERKLNVVVDAINNAKENEND